jgi:hypothetical protein
MNGMSVPRLLNDLLVGFRVEQAAELTAVARLHFEQPALPVGIAVDQLGRRAQGLAVVGDDLARHRAVHVGRRLHGLDDCGGAALGQRTADFRHFDEHQIAERALRVIGDADGHGAVAFDAGPLVRVEILEVVWDVGHELSLSES